MELMKLTQRHIDDFAKIGLRTLAVARRKLTLDEYQTFESGTKQLSTFQFVFLMKTHYYHP